MCFHLSHRILCKESDEDVRVVLSFLLAFFISLLEGRFPVLWGSISEILLIMDLEEKGQHIFGGTSWWHQVLVETSRTFSEEKVEENSIGVAKNQRLKYTASFEHLHESTSINPNFLFIFVIVGRLLSSYMNGLVCYAKILYLFFYLFLFSTKWQTSCHKKFTIIDKGWH